MFNLSDIPHRSENCFAPFAEIFQQNQEAFEDNIFLVNVMSWGDYLDHHIEMLKEELEGIDYLEHPELNRDFEMLAYEIKEARQEERKNNLKMNYLLS